MKKLFIAFSVMALLAGGASAVYAWGVWGHNHINKGAVLALPREIGMFFYNHADFITEESTVPDIRKHMNNDRTEGARQSRHRRGAAIALRGAEGTGRRMTTTGF